MTHLVSILIAAHNAEAFIDNAVASALSQTHRNVEVLVVDDGSTDATAALVAQAAARDPRVVLVQQNPNRGVSAARNLGLRRASGEWVAILDADDAFRPDRIETLLGFALAEGLDMVADNMAMHEFETGAPIGNAFPDDWMQWDRDVSLSFLLSHDIPGIWTREMGFFKPMIRRNFLLDHGIGYAEDVYSAEDALLYAQCLRAGARMRFMKEPMYLYALRQGSLSALKSSGESNRKVSQMLIDGAAEADRHYEDLLRLRKAAAGYEVFIWHVRNRRYGAALAVAADMPPLFLARKLTVFALRRLGQNPENPTMRMLDAIKRRAGETLAS
jgi:glycosyltransferase involved in cell wall biosynthesis